MNDEQRKRRNFIIAAAVGGFLLPLAGAVGALVVYSRGDREAGRVIAATTVAGLIAYIALYIAL